MKSFVAVFDNAPLGIAPWMEAAAKAGGLTLVNQDDMGRWLAEVPGFGKALMDPKIKNFSNPDPSLTPYYRQVLEAQVPDPRVALHGWGWLVYAERVDVCILDSGGLEERRREGIERVGQKRMDDEFLKVKAYLAGEARKRTTPDRILQLQALSEPEKVELAVRFIQRWAR